MRKGFILLLVSALAMCLQAQESQTGLVVGMGRYATDLNPYKAIFAHEMQIFTGIYEGLFSYHPESLEPQLAQAASFSKSADGRTWTFVLRDGLLWSDGSAVTAADYVESWLYLLNPTTKAEYAVFFDIIKGARDYRLGKSKKSENVGIKAIGERTLIVTLDTPAGYFTKMLCHSSFVPIHKSLRNKRTWLPSEVIGNGPFTLASKDAEAMVLVKSNTYWDAKNVALQTIKILFLEDDSGASASAMFNSGEIHWLTDLGNIDEIDLQETIQFAPMFATSYYIWNCARKPWNDGRVRKALALLVPWEKIRNKENSYSPTANLILPFAGYENVTGIEKTDKEAALKLLEEAGFAEPSTLPPLVILIPDYPSQVKTAGIMLEAWVAAGIDVSLEKVPGADFGRQSRQKPYTLSFASWIGDFADPVAFLQMWTSDSSLNETAYKNSEFDKLIEKSMPQDGKERLATLAAAEAMLLLDAALMPTNFVSSFNIIDMEYINGWSINPLDIHPFKTISFGSIAQPPSFASLVHRGER